MKDSTKRTLPEITYWDTLIVAADERCGCRFLLSANFNEGRSSGGVTVVTPFNSPPPVPSRLGEVAAEQDSTNAPDGFIWEAMIS